MNFAQAAWGFMLSKWAKTRAVTSESSAGTLAGGFRDGSNGAGSINSYQIGTAH